MTEPFRVQLSTHDPEVMTTNLTVTGPNTTIEKRRKGKFSVDFNAVRFGGLSLMCISTRNIRVLTEPSSGYTSLHIPLRAGSGFEIDRCGHCDQYDSTDAYLHNMEEYFELSSANTRVLVANCDDSFLMTEALKLGGGEHEPSLDLHHRISLYSKSGAELSRAASSLWLLAGREDGSPASALTIAAGEKEIAAAILLAAGIDNGPPLSSIGKNRSVAAIKRAEDWIAANLDRPISRADLCSASGLQLRALTRAFAKYHGEGPMQFVKDRRLDAVNRTLLGSESGDMTVTRAATNMGFYHLSRFATDYYATFGEHPSETLHG